MTTVFISLLLATRALAQTEVSDLDHVEILFAIALNKTSFYEDHLSFATSV